MSTQQIAEAIQVLWLYSTVSQFVKRHPAFTIGGIRNQIFLEESNGLKESGAIIRTGRKLVIKESAYFAWLEGGVK